MARRRTHSTCQTRQTRQKRPNLLTAGKLRPPTLSKQEIAQFLNIPVSWVRKIVFRPHQVCISWRNRAGNTCSSFFSYRRFASWQTTVIERIWRCQNLPELKQLAALIAVEYKQFDYVVEMMDAIDEVVSDRQLALEAVLS